MKINCKLFIVVLFFEIVAIAFTDSFTLYSQKFERFSNKEGFNQNTISTIEQDQYGFLWYGTPNGLIRYDGYEFKTYTTQSDTEGKILSNFITHLYNDDNGILWIGTNLGLNAYVPSLEKFFTVPLPERVHITNIDSGPNGQIWFSGQKGIYVCVLKNIEKGFLTVSNNLLELSPREGIINDFSFKDYNALLVAKSDGLLKLSLEIDNHANFPKINSFIELDDFENNGVITIFNKNNMFWLGTQNGLFKVTFEGDKAHVINTFSGLGKDKTHTANFIVNTIFEDNSGSVWIGTKGHGLYKNLEAGDYFEHFSNDPKNRSGLSSQIINALFQDDFGVLWVGTAQAGINKLDLTQKKFINYTNNPYDRSSLSDNLIMAILEDNRGKLWLSGYNNALFRSRTVVNDATVDRLKFEKLNAKLTLSPNDVLRSIYEDKKGYIWFGTDFKIVVYNPSTDKFKELVLEKNGKPLEIERIRIMRHMNDSTLLLAGSQLTVIENPWKSFDSKDFSSIKVKSNLDLKPEDANTVLTLDDGSFWVGTDRGLFHGNFDKDSISIDQRISEKSANEINLTYRNVFSLHKDNSGSIWVGTFGGGLNKMSLDDSGFVSEIKSFRKNDVLPDDAIYSILQEKDDYLWMSTDMGLVRFHTTDTTTDVFDVRDGLPQNNFRQGAYFKGKSGYFYYGGLNGLTIFKPENIELNLQPPQILISSLLIDNKQVKIGEEWNNKVILEKSISETDAISISQTQRIISLNVVVEHTSRPSKNKLAYKLEGFNDQWVTADKGKATITYTNLAAGDYVLKFRAANGDGVWTEATRDLKIEITPPWYQTWWSYLILFFTVFAVCVGLMVYFLKLERLKQKLKYEELDKERIEIINQGKFRYFTNLSHEFRTPLTLIAGPLERVVDLNTDSGIHNYLAIIKKNTKRLLSLADQLITFRQAEQGHIDLNLTKCTLGEFIYPTTEAFESYAIDKNINFFYKVNSPNEEVIVDIEKCERIIFNLLSNAFKNTPLQGTIRIELGISFKSQEKIIHIDIIDSGKGIPKEHLDNIFERFYQLGNENGNVSGGGIGLAFCKSLIKLLGGEISAKSEPGVETRFSVTIPSRPISTIDSETPIADKKSYINDWVPLSSESLQHVESNLNTKSAKKHTILIVENEEDVQNFLISAFSGKYKVRIAGNGVEALQKVREKEPDLIVSDVMMPEMDGYELCEKIKSDSETCHLPILLLTALGDNENVIKGLEFGADDYVSKPFSVKHLELRIEKLIQTNIKIKKYFKKNSFLPKDKDVIELNKKDKLFLESINTIMEKNLADSNFGVEELSKEIGLSISTFYRRLKQLTGQVPNVYLRNFRLQKAMELLRGNEGYNVAEVMDHIGIESNSYFSTSFKKLHGVSPSELLKKK